MEYRHVPVLLNETVDSLKVRPDGNYVDCTLGGGGHSSKILDALGSGHLYAMDEDQAAINYNVHHLNSALRAGKVTLIHDNFCNLGLELKRFAVNRVDGILYDLGVSSPQFDDAQRGFSYRKDAKLDMRMDRRNHLNAWIIVNRWSIHKLIEIFFRYGNEKFARSIAKRIKYHRVEAPVNTTKELAKIIKEGIPAAARRHGGNPARRVFQALRMVVNDELGTLRKSLTTALHVIGLYGRISVITFEPLEDKLVKDLFKKMTTLHDVPRGLPVIPKRLKPHFRLVNRKPIRPGRRELRRNYRSHSARLRVIERVKPIRPR